VDEREEMHLKKEKGSTFPRNEAREPWLFLSPFFFFPG
jgi:hypothetical protein